MTEVSTSVMLGWLRALPPEQAMVIRERIERDGHEIAALKNDRDHAADQSAAQLERIGNG